MTYTYHVPSSVLGLEGEKKKKSPGRTKPSPQKLSVLQKR